MRQITKALPAVLRVLPLLRLSRRGTKQRRMLLRAGACLKLLCRSWTHSWGHTWLR
jgi:hypothetical protein